MKIFIGTKKAPFQDAFLVSQVLKKFNVAGNEKTEREIQFKTPLNLENFH